MSGKITEVAFSQLTREDQIHLLLQLAHELTIIARDTYSLDGNGVHQPPRLRSINEVQHRVLAHSLALLKDAPKRYPDQVLLRLILEHPEDSELEQQIRHAFTGLLKQASSAA